MILTATLAWYWILTIVLGVVLFLFFAIFFFFLFNGDGKMIEKIYNFLNKYHEKHKRDEKI